MLANYRKIIVLLANDSAVKPLTASKPRAWARPCSTTTRRAAPRSNARWPRWPAPGQATRFDAIGGLLDFIESDPGLFDADRLAFRELLQGLLTEVARDSSLL
ncbi:hypothetical protein LP420_07250 [Massilia sp. B-10]|nr:hypothetical protein LP420_07250 [Massilia sp. B-10]